MANLRHPYDVSIEDLGFLKHELVKDFIEDDGVICEKERGILIQFETAVARMRQARGLERGIELLMKQEGRPTRYTKTVFEDLGVKLEPLDCA